jgi:anti-sigma regulatory factor (Ser/Thr protein kinase)
MLHLVLGHDAPSIAAELAPEIDARRHDSIDALLAAAEPSQEQRLLLFVPQVAEFADAKLRRLHAALPRLRSVVLTSRLGPHDERRLLAAGACRVLQRPWPCLPLDAWFEDRTLLALRFPGRLPADSRERHSFELPTEASASAPAIRAILERIEARGADAALLRVRLPVVLDELLTNAMEHGNRWQRHKRVHIDLELDGRHCMLRVRDQGEGFDRRGVPDPTRAELSRRPRGRGLHLVESQVDTVQYEDGGRGVVVRCALWPVLSSV